MATVNFTIRETTKNKRCSINYYVSIARGKRIRGTTNILILPEYWNPETQLLRNKKEVSKIRDDVNEKLKNFDSFVFNKLNDYSSIEIEHKQKLLKNDIDIYFNKKKDTKEEESLNLMKFYDWYIKHYSNHPLPSTGKNMSNSTVRTYNSGYNLIKEFNSSIYPINYDDITLKFYDDFISFLTDKDLSLNYIGSQIKILKTIMNVSFEKDLHKSLDFKKKHFKKPSEEVHNIYLTIDELKKIENADFSEIKKELISKTLYITKELAEKARDLFLIGAYSGLRISDFKKLTPDNFIEENKIQSIRVKTQKTGKFVTIPLHPVIKKILKKREGKPPESIPEQHINYAIKKIGEIAELTTLYTKEITKGGKLTTITKPKHYFIASHTARRSFCTNAYKSGMPVADIMQLSGHNSEKVFYNYIKLNDIEKAEKISTNKFFN